MLQFTATFLLGALLPFISLLNQGHNLENSFFIFIENTFFISTVIAPCIIAGFLGYYLDYETTNQPYPIVISNTVKFAFFMLMTNLISYSTFGHQSRLEINAFPVIVTDFVVFSTVFMTFAVMFIRKVGLIIKVKTKGKRKVLLVTYPIYKTYIVNEIQSDSKYQVACVHDNPIYHKENLTSHSSIENNDETLFMLCQKHKISYVVLDTPYMRSEKLLNEIYECRQNHINVEELPHFLERVFRKVPLLHIESGDKIINSEMQVEQKSLPLVRFFNVAVSLLVLTVYITCILPCIIIAMLISMPGPIFFIQKRVGLFDQIFSIYKIRTMHTDQKQFKKEDLSWAQNNDPRIPFLGKILRQLKLDEFPQFYNVIKGEMNIVGPRPQMLTMIDKYETIIPYYSRRHLVRPGLSGWAQINHPALSSTEDVIIGLQYDLYYVKHRSLVFDIYIIFMTSFHIIKMGLKSRKKAEKD